VEILVVVIFMGEPRDVQEAGFGIPVARAPSLLLQLGISHVGVGDLGGGGALELRPHVGVEGHGSRILHEIVGHPVDMVDGHGPLGSAIAGPAQTVSGGRGDGRELVGDRACQGIAHHAAHGKAIFIDPVAIDVMAGGHGVDDGQHVLDVVAVGAEIPSVAFGLGIHNHDLRRVRDQIPRG
jgi:hypothetical protein